MNLERLTALLELQHWNFPDSIEGAQSHLTILLDSIPEHKVAVIRSMTVMKDVNLSAVSPAVDYNTMSFYVILYSIFLECVAFSISKSSLVRRWTEENAN